MSGFALFHRSLIGHPAFRNDAEGMAFAWMVLKASWRPSRVRYKGRAVALDRGQLSVSQRDMAAALDRDKAWVERLWKRLRDEAMITVAYEAGAAVITICNYDKYQVVSDAREAVDEAPEKARARQAQGTEQEGKEGKEEKGKPRKRERTPDFEIPVWVPAGPWAAFCAMRKSKGKPVDSYIAERLFTKLSGIQSDGWDLAKVLDKATTNFWIDVYKPTPGRDDDLRSAGGAKPSGPFDMAEYQARMARLDARGFAPDARHAEPERRNGSYGAPRSIGEVMGGLPLVPH